SVARAALLGARGNSGVILSQLIRGAAEELVSRPGQLIDATLIGAALAHAADRAYASVRNPAEGTILTVVREMAHKIVTDVAHSPENPRFGPATAASEQDAAIAETLERAVIAGQESVKRGPELLAVVGEVSRLDVADMRLQVAQRDERVSGEADGAADAPDPRARAPLPTGGANGARRARCGAVAVVNGAGLAEMFRELGVHTIDG